MAKKHVSMERAKIEKYITNITQNNIKSNTSTVSQYIFPSVLGQFSIRLS